jgi:hypothetical protein
MRVLNMVGVEKMCILSSWRECCFACQERVIRIKMKIFVVAHERI